MNMKFCPNYSCVAYGRVTYTQATRCAFCRWDLKPPRMKSETLTQQQIHPESTDKSLVATSRVTSRPQLRVRQKRSSNLLPHTA